MNFHFQPRAIVPDRTVYVSFRTYLNGGKNPSSVVYVGVEGAASAVNPDGSQLWEYRHEYGNQATAVGIGSDGTTYLAFQATLVAVHDVP